MRETDAQLLAAAQSDASANAFEQILYRYEKLIYHIARRYFYNPEDAMDAGQEAALRIFRGLPRVQIAADGTLKSWICTVTANVCLDMVRKRRVETEELTEETPHSAHGTAPSAEENAAARERVREITAAIAKLPSEQKMILILRDLNGLSYDELAESLGITIGTVKSRLSRARAALKKMIKD